MNELTKDIMEDQRLLASAALFRQLHENKKDIYEVLGQFIRTSIILNRSWFFNVTSISRQLFDDFGFKIPEAVVKSCLKHRLKKEGYVDLNQAGGYSVTCKFDKGDSILSNFESVKNEQEIIKEELISYVENALNKKLDVEEKKDLVASFYSYFINDDRNSVNAILISQFIIKNSKDNGFTARLNTVEEGLLLYHGINFSSGLITHIAWTKDLQLYLDTEVLFDAVGLNGSIHQQIFNEFNDLVKGFVANQKNKVKIELKFFEETQREVEDFYYAAEKLVEKNKQPHPNRSGMIDVVNGCKTPADVVAKKSAFFDKLRRLKITLDEGADYYSNADYNMESLQRLSKIKATNPDYEDGKLADVLRIFTKINYKRKGMASKSFETCGALLITGKGITRNAAYIIAMEENDRRTQFAYDLDFITEKLWFRLNKGFGGDSRLPTTFDVVARAQVVLSSQTGNKITHEFRSLVSDVEQGLMSKEMAGYMVSDLRSRSFKPEDFIPETIDENISFMQDDFLEKTARDIAHLEYKAKEGAESQLRAESLALELKGKEQEKQLLEEDFKERLQSADDRRRNELRKQKIIFLKQTYSNYRSKAKRYYSLMLWGYYIIAILLSVLFFAVLYTPADSNLSIISGFSPLVVTLISAKWFKAFAKKKSLSKYREWLSELKIGSPDKMIGKLFQVE